MKGGKSIRGFDPDDMPFQVVQWDTEYDRPHRVLAASVNVSFALAAWNDAKDHPDYSAKQILLMQGARVMRDSSVKG
jgi:hypothetical protein